MILPIAIMIAFARPESPPGQLIFSPPKLPNPGGCIFGCPNGDMLPCWYRGSGERGADDVRIVGARLRKGDSRWSDVFDMADTPGLPDCNPCMCIDPTGKLWLFWSVILDNHWESALMKYRVST